ncbi:hypothetical protein [Flavobacterium beibuense]|uniref:Uncharacterized protein n=1 Tax=Flavobacterium beibuense TaxID=657326 RepID=A0A444W6M3_9FLAO|nr:hypothetical protein [Flavobacterium beibuense]RYJ41525.1 hypothetical protein NU09_2899 [Flavobacterium beibuense]
MESATNNIKSLLDRSDYEIYPDFLNFYIDSYWLDEKLEELYPAQSFKGLIPTLSPSIQSESEKEVVWNRILPLKNTSSICPILMCPDDCDFSCTLIVAEIYNIGEQIHWKKIGIDKTKEWDPNKTGSTVEWLSKVAPYKFCTEDYIKMLDNFRAQF